MRIAYLDCFAGISGDMLLGALIDAGVPAAVLQEAASALDLGASLKIERVDRSGISCTRVHVLEHGHLAEGEASEAIAGHQHSSVPHTHETGRRDTGTKQAHDAGHAHRHDEGNGSHLHDEHHARADAHTHPHEHAPVHGRSLSVIRELIKSAPLAEPVKKLAIRAFDLLGQSEAKIHNVSLDEIHFHEVGAVDAIVDIVAASAGMHHLQVDAWFCSPLNVGGGMVECAHGTFPVPAPATADLLRGLPTYSAQVQKELVTPTGAALLRALDPGFGQQPSMRVEQIGYGAGTRNPKGFPNVLRLSVGDAEQGAETSAGTAQASQQQVSDQNAATVTVLETALDDLSPQVLAWVAASALEAGALDVMLTPVIMKKGRPGTLLTVLCDPVNSAALERLIFRETSTLGLRIRQDRRSCLDRRHVPVQTPFGEIRVKVGSRGDEVQHAAPEFEDCRAAAGKHGVPLKQVQQAAIAAFERKSDEQKSGEQKSDEQKSEEQKSDEQRAAAVSIPKGGGAS